MDHAHSVPPLNDLLIQQVHLLGRPGHTILPLLHAYPTAYHCVICTNDTAPVSHPHVFGALRDMCKADGGVHSLPQGTAPVVQPHFFSGSGAAKVPTVVRVLLIFFFIFYFLLGLTS